MKNHLYLRSRVLNTPLFISKLKLEMITEAVLMPIILGEKPNTVLDTSIKDANREVIAAKSYGVTKDTNLAIVNVYDSLQARGIAGGLSGFTTYESIRTSLQNAVDAGYTNILLIIDSPGGEVTGLFALTEYMRSLSAKGITLTSYIDGSATSAAYAIAAATSKKYATNTSLIGSIAAIMVHLETSKEDIANGKTYTILRSKEYKALGDSHTPLTEKVKNKFQVLLDNIDTLFNNDIIASMPQLSLQNIIDMKGSEFIASEALQLGLIDSIVTGVDSAIEKALQNNKSLTRISAKTNFKEINMNEEELKTTLLQTQMELSTVRAELVELEATVRLAEQTRVLGILASCTTLKLPIDTAVKHIQRGFSTETSLEIQTEIAEALSKSSIIDGVSGLSASTDPDLDIKLKDKEIKFSKEANIAALRAGIAGAGLKLKVGV